MPAKSQNQLKFIYGKRSQYGSKKDTPNKFKWIWAPEWTKGVKTKELPKKVAENEILREMIREELEKQFLDEGIGKTLATGALAGALMFGGPKIGQAHTGSGDFFGKIKKTEKASRSDVDKTTDLSKLTSGFVDQKDSSVWDFGTSPDISMAKKMALFNAKQKLAQFLKTNELKNINIISEKLFRDKDNNYIYWVQIKEE